MTNPRVLLLTSALSQRPLIQRALRRVMPNVEFLIRDIANARSALTDPRGLADLAGHDILLIDLDVRVPDNPQFEGIETGLFKPIVEYFHKTAPDTLVMGYTRYLSRESSAAPVMSVGCDAVVPTSLLLGTELHEATWRALVVSAKSSRDVRVPGGKRIELEDDSDAAQLDADRPLVLLLGNIDHEGILSSLAATNRQY